uniref:ribosomal protein S5 n=1 Tax=Haramonas pauciplastida TaxID=478668 RepID=UPI0021158276|nr:ribosomal protein S5 [Haramonas pauciplastida]UTE94965.1 ribosomal protein S5 [Haramonas pauciplastida]
MREKKKSRNIVRKKRSSHIVSKPNYKIVNIKRVSKVVKGGKKLSFRTIIIIGNKKGNVGLGIGKANDVSNSIKKAINNGKKNLITLPVTKHATIPHIVKGKFGASNVIICPSKVGSGVIAGSSIRTVLEVAGIRNVLAKQIGSNNLLNNARATLDGLKQLKTINKTAKERNLNVETLYF